MTYIKTKEALSDYILSTLGSPIITIEVSDTQISNHIDFAVQKFSSFAMGGDSPKVYLLNTVAGVNKYVLDDRVESVVRVKTNSSGLSMTFPGGIMLTPTDMVTIAAGGAGPGSGGFDVGNMLSMYATMDIFDHFFSVEPNWTFSSNSKVLEFLDSTPQTVTRVLVEAYVAYEPQASDMIYNHQFVKDYATALVKRQWGNNIGKINATLINGATMNYDRILAEATAELDRLDADLLTKWSQPLPITRA